MKVNELMVGDLLRVNKDVCLKKGTIVEVRGVDADNEFIEKGLKGCATCVNINDHCESGGIWVDFLEPIPLTSEILDKNFERKEHGWQVKDCWKIWANPNYGYILSTLVMDDFGGGSYEPCIPCTYLHELQNAMTVLRAGKEIKQ